MAKDDLYAKPKLRQTPGEYMIRLKELHGNIFNVSDRQWGNMLLKEDRRFSVLLMDIFRWNTPRAGLRLTLELHSFTSGEHFMTAITLCYPSPGQGKVCVIP